MDFREVLRDSALKRAYHAFWMYRGKIYFHGGITKQNMNEEPKEDVVEIDLSSRRVISLLCKNSGPKRSHHKCVIIGEKWACLVGGWDGRQRTTDIWTLDMENLQWSILTADITCNPPAGLSSHTCTKVWGGDVIITGREGGVRMQRRYGSVYKLVIDAQHQFYSYKEMPQHISSRSGHAACLVKNDSTSLKPKSKYLLLIHGGRDSDSAEIVKSWSSLHLDFSPSTVELESRLKSYLPPNVSLQSTEKNPNVKTKLVATKHRSLRHHAVIEAGTLCLIHGGEVFGKARDTVSGDIFVHNSTASKWWILKELSDMIRGSDNCILKRMGHSICYMDGLLYIMSGIGSNGKTAEGSIVSISF